jgi:hypothetical protein
MIVEAGIGLLGGIIGGIAKRRAAKKQRALIDRQLRDNENWYNRRYNEDSTQRADAQNALRIMRETMDERSKRATASGVVAGATDESVARQKASANNALGNTVANIAAAGDRRKDAIEQQYMDTKSQLNAAKGNAYARQGQNTASAIGGLVSTIPALMDANIGDIFKGKPTASEVGEDFGTGTMFA